MPLVPAYHTIAHSKASGRLRSDVLISGAPANLRQNPRDEASTMSERFPSPNSYFSRLWTILIQ